MADLSRCPVTDLLADECACKQCRNLPDLYEYKPTAVRRNDEGMGPWFRANRVGRCANCATGIEPGDRIRADRTGGYVAECCGEDDDG